MKIKLLKPGMEVEFWHSYQDKIKGENTEVGYFQAWGVDFIELEDGLGSVSSAIVMSCGHIFNVSTQCIVVTEESK